MIEAKRKPDSCLALKSSSEMICRIQRGHRSFLLIRIDNIVDCKDKVDNIDNFDSQYIERIL